MRVRGVVGIGLDLVELEEFDAMLKRRGARLLRRVFTDGEIAYCRAKQTSLESFAARFAAKEAAFKALGTGWGAGVDWRDVEVAATAGASPRLDVHGRFAELARARGARRFLVTLTHTRHYASAMVVLAT